MPMPLAPSDRSIHPSARSASARTWSDATVAANPPMRLSGPDSRIGGIPSASGPVWSTEKRGAPAVSSSRRVASPFSHHLPPRRAVLNTGSPSMRQASPRPAEGDHVVGLSDPGVAAPLVLVDDQFTLGRDVPVLAALQRSAPVRLSRVGDRVEDLQVRFSGVRVDVGDEGRSGVFGPLVPVLALDPEDGVHRSGSPLDEGLMDHGGRGVDAVRVHEVQKRATRADAFGDQVLGAEAYAGGVELDPVDEPASTFIHAKAERAGVDLRETALALIIHEPDRRLDVHGALHLGAVLQQGTGRTRR